MTRYTVHAYLTRAGKVAVKATDSVTGLTKVSYFAPGYRHYLVGVWPTTSRWDPKARDLVPEPELQIHVDKRTNSAETAWREYRLRGDENTVWFSRSSAPGGYSIRKHGHEITQEGSGPVTTTPSSSAASTSAPTTRAGARSSTTPSTPDVTVRSPGARSTGANASTAGRTRSSVTPTPTWRPTGSTRPTPESVGTRTTETRRRTHP